MPLFFNKIIDILDIYIQTLDLVGPQLDTGYIEEFKSLLRLAVSKYRISHSVQSFFYQLDQQVRGIIPTPFRL